MKEEPRNCSDAKKIKFSVYRVREEKKAHVAHQEVSATR